MCGVPTGKARAGGHRSLVLIREFRPWKGLLLLVGQCCLGTMFDLEEFGGSFVIKVKLGTAKEQFTFPNRPLIRSVLSVGFGYDWYK